MFSLALILMNVILAAQAAIYVVKPSDGSTCHASASCTVHWEDDGQRPLLSAIKMTTVGLYHGNQKLVQTLKPVDVSSSISFTFTPNPQAGPNSDAYYIAFTSVDLQTNGSAYQGFSPFFRLDSMSGSFASPLPAATSSIPIPSHTTSAGTRMTTITNGTPSSLPVTSQPSSSGFLTSLSSPSVTASASKPTTTSNAILVASPSLRCLAVVVALLYLSISI